MMVNYTFLSIVIPVYNLKDHIIKTLKSLISQDTSRIEIIIIDDGSSDETANIANQFLMKCTQIDYKIVQKLNGGVSSARNRGIREANGEYIFFLDGDDYVAEDFIKTLYRYIENNSSDVLCWAYDIVSVNNKLIKGYFDKFKIDQLSAMTGTEALQNIIIEKKLWIWTCSAVYKREFVLKNNLRYIEGCSNGEDQEFTFKALVKAKDVVFINKVMSFYVQREGSISNKYDIKRFDVINAMQRTYQYIINDYNIDLKEIANYFKNEKIIENYLYNLQSCFKYLNTNSVEEILLEIDKVYPNLNREVLTIMGKYKGEKLKNVLRIKLFLKSPKVYFCLVKFKYRLKEIKYDVL